MDFWNRYKQLLAGDNIHSHPANRGFFSFLKNLLYLPRVMSGREKRTALILLLVFGATGISLMFRLYIRFTHSVPQVAGSFTEGMIGEPRTINPIFAVRDTDRDIARLLFAGLMRYDRDGNIQPDLAERFEKSGDGKTYTFVLRNNVQWHDGKPLNADDIVFTVHMIQNFQFRSPLRANWQGVSVEKIDDQTVRFTLKTPYSPFIENTTLGIIPKHIWQNVSPEQAILHEANLHPIGSGPYRFRSIGQQKDGSISWYELERNSTFHHNGPYLKRITILFFKNEEEVANAWKKGTVEAYGGVLPERLGGINQEHTRVYTLPLPRIFGLFFNTKQAPLLADIKVRMAIAYAINKTAVSESQKLSKATPADAPFPGISAGDPSYPFDPEHARTLLKQAGWTDSNGDGILDKKIRDSKGKTAVQKLHFTLTTSDWPDLIRTAESVQSMLKQIGIEADVQKKPFSELEVTAIRPRNFEILLFGQVYGYERDPFAFWHSSQVKDPGLNITLYMNKTADRYLEEMRKTSDSSSQEQRLKDLAALIAKDLPAVFLYTQYYTYAVPADIQGINLNSVSLPQDRFNQIENWYRYTTRTFFR